MKSPVSPAAGVPAAVPLVAAPRQKGGAKPQTRHVFVHVIDGQGGPVTGLTAGDFTVTEAGAARVVTTAGPAKDPMRIALVLDTSDAAAPALSHLRAGAA